MSSLASNAPLHLPNRKRNRARAMGGRGHPPLPSPRAAQIYARIERGNHQIARGGKTKRGLREIRRPPAEPLLAAGTTRPAAEENRSPWRPRERSLLPRRRGAADPPASGPRRRRRGPHPAARPCGGWGCGRRRRGNGTSSLSSVLSLLGEEVGEAARLAP